MADAMERPSDADGTLATLPVAADSRRMRATGEAAARFGLPLVVFAAFLAIWQFAPPLAGLKSYEMPTFTDTLTGLRDDWGDIGTSLLVTFQDAMGGFLIGNLLAIIGATLFVYSRTIERAFYPLAIVVQSIPIIVFAPILSVVFFKLPGLSPNYQGYAVVGVAVLITMFPTLVNMTAGLKAVDPRVLELMRLLNASQSQIFVKLRFPSSMPFLFSSLKITSTLGFVGAIVGEYMVGGAINPIGSLLSKIGVKSILGFQTNPFLLNGVGQQISIFYSRVDRPGIFASVLAVSILTVLFFGLMVLAERVLVPWRSEQ